MRSWQVAMTLAGWTVVLALILMNLSTTSPATYVVVAIWAVGTVALMKTPPFPSRGIAFAVSWVGPLLVIVSDIYSGQHHRLELFTVQNHSLKLITVSALIQLGLFAVVIGWFCTYGMLPIFAVVKMVRPKMPCRVFEGTDQVPSRYWWVPTLVATTFKAATIWLVWSVVSVAEKQ